MVNYAVETIELIKRYPTTTGGAQDRRGMMAARRSGGIQSFSGILNMIKGTNGPFIEALRGVNLKVKIGERSYVQPVTVQAGDIGFVLIAAQE